ncbi:MAG TPA: isoprenylcysteine carboxylmethyltransferase family protein [Vicinamibacterales bacterium]|jgi:protein-S-isoprenylcysteine O-methyltransferase Ste14
MRALRHLLAIAVLPFTVTVLVPLWIARDETTIPRLGATAAELLLQTAGVGVLAVGLLLFVSSLRRFESEGDGTLAPWDPPQHLVVGGPYRYVRNPMISGVLFVLAAEAMLLLSRPHGLWALTFLGINAVSTPLLEEPMLRARFGEAYREYCRHVPRIVPRLRPWTPDRTPGAPE